MSEQYEATNTHSHARGSGHSTIDYIISTLQSDILWVRTFHGATENCSSHNPITCKVKCSITDQPQVSQNPPAVKPRRPQWPKCNLQVLRTTLSEVFPDVHIDDTPPSIEAYCAALIDALQFAAAKAVPTKPPSRARPKAWSPKVTNCYKANRVALKTWVSAGRPPDPHQTATKKKETKKELRRAMRQAEADKRAALYTEIFQASSSDVKLFHRLIRQQRSQGRSPSNGTVLMLGDELISGETRVLEAWTNHFAKLATPASDPSFEENHYKSVNSDFLIIEQLASVLPRQHPDISLADVLRAINRLNSGKAADIHGLAPEHIKLTAEVCAPLLVPLFRAMLDTGTIPTQLQQSYIIPVHKRGKDPLSSDNYRGISISPIINKVFEHVITQKTEPLMSQNSLQFGFTKVTSPAFAVLAVTEAIAEAKDLHIPIYMVALDVKKAFDTVDHKSLLKKHFNQGMDPNTWTCLRQNLESTAQARVGNCLGESFPIKQGVGQGKIQSTTSYKTYVNDLIDILVESKEGMYIGCVPVPAPYCADDAILLALTLTGLQAMLQMTEDYAARERYIIHPQKSQGMALGTTEQPDVTICGTQIKFTDSITHLGVTRYRSKQGWLTLDDTILDRVSMANNTIYALMGAGLHGVNGLSPAVTLHMYLTYAVPRLMYGLECLTLLKKHLKTINQFHRSVLRRLQTLPARTATCATHLLIGCPPAEAILDKSIAGLLYNIGLDQTSTIYRLAKQQLSTKDLSSHSWFIYALKRLETYGLQALELIDRCTTLASAKQKITSYWERTLREEARSRSSLRFLDIERCSISKPHRLWKSSQFSPQGTRHSIIRAKLLVGVYTLQANRANFNQHEVDPTCKMCGAAPEDRVQFLLQCQSLYLRHEPRPYNRS